jgi:hypothetical protein
MKGSDFMKPRSIFLLIMVVDMKMNGGGTCHLAEAAHGDLTTTPSVKLTVAGENRENVQAGVEQ